MEKKKYPMTADHYALYEEVGSGVSGAVHRALCITLNEIVAIKIMDFERDNCDLNRVYREVQTMLAVDHPNVLRSHCSFVNGHNLWVVMPYMAGGSCLHILETAYPDGFKEDIIATLLKEVLKALDYLHSHGLIHRDVKAGNILVGAHGEVKLSNFGVSACLFDSGDRQRPRKSLAGTPCWMAPEVMEQVNGYDFRADIWSFAITALEFAHGHAPFSNLPPYKVFLTTLQNAPPGLDYERDKKFSKSFRDVISICLEKNPSKRPAAKTLLKHPFFKQAKSSDYIVRMLLNDLPVLDDRLQELKRRDEVMLSQKRIPDGEKEEISQGDNNQSALPSSADSICSNTVAKCEKSDDDVSMASSMQAFHSSSNCFTQNLSDLEIYLPGKVEPEINGKSPNKLESYRNQSDKFHIQIPSPSSCNIDFVAKTVCGTALENSSRASKTSDEKAKGPVVQQRGRFKVTSENADFEKFGSPLQKSQSMQVISQHPAAVSLPVTPTDTASPKLPMHFPYPMIQFLLRSNILEREYILRAMKQLATGESTTVNQAVNCGGCLSPEKFLLESAHDREKDLLREISDLQRRLTCIQEELQKHKTEHPPADS